MVGEENSHYTGKVEKYEDGKVLFRLDSKIGEFRRSIRGMKRSISIDEGDFYIASGIDANNGEKIISGNEYKMDRKYLYKIIKEILRDREKRGKKVTSLDDEINLEGIDFKGEITGIGIQNILNEGNEKDEEN